jgi:hypothetical protein
LANEELNQRLNKKFKNLTLVASFGILSLTLHRLGQQYSNNNKRSQSYDFSIYYHVQRQSCSRLEHFLCRRKYLCFQNALGYSSSCKFCNAGVVTHDRRIGSTPVFLSKGYLHEATDCRWQRRSNIRTNPICKLLADSCRATQSGTEIIVRVNRPLVAKN